MRLSLPTLIAAAVLLAMAEWGVYLFSGAFFAMGRAEALPFIALRPWILLAAALIVVRQPIRCRALFYALFLVMAAGSETLLVLGLGAEDPWLEMLRGLVAGAILALLLDLVLQASRRLWRWGPVVASLALLLLFLTPFALQPYATFVMPDDRPVVEAKPDLMLMTALPIIWGEGGAFDPTSRPAAAYLALEREFEVRPIDVLDERSLGSGRLLLLAQPRALAPEELVALDEWVRAGGKALILTDPRLHWPSKLPLGDIRRPPPVGLLGPLLRHWGLRLEPGPAENLVEPYRWGDHDFRIAMAAPGRFSSQSDGCDIWPGGWMAHCRIGEGIAAIVADADLMHDSLWAPLGPARHQRTADNPLLVAEWLDALASIDRPRQDRLVQWAAPDADPVRALLLAMIPLAAGLGVAFALHLRRRR